MAFTLWPPDFHDQGGPVVGALPDGTSVGVGAPLRNNLGVHTLKTHILTGATGKPIAAPCHWHCPLTGYKGNRTAASALDSFFISLSPTYPFDGL
jgi:hypothetical protein